jgi:HSP20 family molecular chaperone IbpA
MFILLNRHHPNFFHPYSTAEELYAPRSCRRYARCSSQNQNNKEDATEETNHKTKSNNAEKKCFHAEVQTHIDENDHNVTLSLDVPGFKESDLKLELLERGIIRISGERTNKFNYTSKFSRHFTLDGARVDLNNIQPNLVDGVLSITFPKRELAQPRAIPISIEANAKSQDEDTAEKKPENEEEIEVPITNDVTVETVDAAEEEAQEKAWVEVDNKD